MADLDSASNSPNHLVATSHGNGKQIYRGGRATGAAFDAFSEPRGEELKPCHEAVPEAGGTWGPAWPRRRKATRGPSEW